MIEASRCPACERVAVPGEPTCRACGASTSQDSVEPSGRVLACTRLEEAWVGLVELASGARVLARSREALSVGDPVRVEPRPDGFGVESAG